mgnify:FL=1
MEVTEVQYKESEIGVIPVDWEVKQLSTIGKFTKGQGIRKDEATNGEIPCVRYGELYTRHNDYIKEYFSFISNETAKSARRLRPGDILFAGSGETKEEIGKCAAFVDNIEAYAGGDIVILSPIDVSPLFLGYLLNAQHIQKQKASKGQGDAIVHISANQLGSIQIPLPPTKSEQTAIATALSDTDALIENLEKLIAKKRNIKQGVMQELLKPKNGWGIKKLGDFIRLQTGFPFSSEYFSDNPKGQRLIKNRDLRSDDSIVYYSGDYAKEFIVQNNDLLIGMDGDFEPVLWKKGNALLNQRVGRILKIKEISIPFLSFTLLKELKEIEVRTSSTTVKHLSHSDINKIEMPLPNFEKQTHIATILTDMDADIYALEKKLNKIKQIKQGMMQALLTGKIRLV